MLVILQPTALLLLDLSAAFDTIDHSILTHRLQHWFGISSTALNLLSSLLSDRSQTVITSASQFQPALLEHGVPKSSVLRPLLYTLYTTPLHFIMSKYPGLRCHFYADDTRDVHGTWKRGIPMDSHGNGNQIA